MNNEALIQSIKTPTLTVAYEEHGPASGDPIILLHGFPYSPRGYDEIAPALAVRGYRVIVPYLRGYGPTRFNSPNTLRSGQQAALAQDLLDLMDAQAISKATLCGRSTRTSSISLGFMSGECWRALATTFPKKRPKRHSRPYSICFSADRKPLAIRLRRHAHGSQKTASERFFAAEPALYGHPFDRQTGITE